MENSLSDPSAALSFSLRKAFNVDAELLPLRIGDNTCNFSFAAIRLRGKMSSIIKLKISRAVASSSLSVVSTHAIVTLASPKSMDGLSEAMRLNQSKLL